MFFSQLEKSSRVWAKESSGGAAYPRHVLVVAVVVAKVPEQRVAAGDALHADPRPVVTIIRDGVQCLLH